MKQIANIEHYSLLKTLPRDLPDREFYLTHPFLDLVSARCSSWQTAHPRVGGVQPLNLEANMEMALFRYLTSNSCF